MSATVLEGSPVQLTGAHDKLEPTMTVVPVATNEDGKVTLDTISDDYLRARLGQITGAEVLDYDARNKVSTVYGKKIGWMSVSFRTIHPELGVREHEDIVSGDTSHYLGLDRPSITLLGLVAVAQPDVRVK